MDLKKVILTIEGDEPSNPGGDGDNKPSNPGTDEDNKPSNPGTDNGDKPSNPGTDDGNKPSNPGTDDTNKPTTPVRPPSSGGSSGGSSSGGSSGSSGGGGGSSSSRKPSSKNPDGSQNSGYRPSIPNHGGSWSQDGSGNWLYTLPDGKVPLAQWVADGKGWYWFDENGNLVYDWFLDVNGNWYMLDKRPETLGRCLYGWYFEQMDQKWYYFDVQDGHMLTGWQYIDGKWYYFTVHNAGQTYFGDNVNGWKFDPINQTKPYGSMFSNEKTPDGYSVAESGEWIK